MQRQHQVLALTACSLLAVMIAANILIRNSIDREKSAKQFVTPQGNESIGKIPPKQTIKDKPKKRKLVPEDPSKYGIIEYTKAEQPRNQLQWDLFMQKVIVDSKILEKEGAAEALKEAKTKPENFIKKEKEIDERIKILQKEAASNPSDQETAERLQRLYMLRAVMKRIEDDVTAP